MKNINILLFCFMVLSIHRVAANYTNFVIVVASYNNLKFYKKNLDSIVNQKIKLSNKRYPNYRIIYINDYSLDQTGSLVDKYIQKNDLHDLVKVIHNKKRQGHLFNQYYAIHSCTNQEVVVIVDGDDFLYDDYVLDYLNKIYSDKNVWLTYGQSQHWTFKKIGVSKHIPKYYFDKKLLRKIPWCFSHLRTFYAGLFKKIQKQDLIYQGSFFKSAADVATMYPMLEMAGYKHVKFIPKVLYLYNTINPNSFFRRNINRQFNLANFIKNKSNYSYIKSIF